MRLSGSPFYCQPVGDAVLGREVFRVLGARCSVGFAVPGSVRSEVSNVRGKVDRTGFLSRPAVPSRARPSRLSCAGQPCVFGVREGLAIKRVGDPALEARQVPLLMLTTPIECFHGSWELTGVPRAPHEA